MLRAYTAPRTARVAAAMMDGFLSKLGDEIAGQPPGIFDRQPQAEFYGLPASGTTNLHKKLHICAVFRASFHLRFCRDDYRLRNQSPSEVFFQAHFHNQ